MGGTGRARLRIHARQPHKENPMTTAVQTQSEYRNLPLVSLMSRQPTRAAASIKHRLANWRLLCPTQKRPLFRSRFVAERHEWRFAASGPRSERHITDQRNANATDIRVREARILPWQVERLSSIIHAEGVREYCSTDN